MTTKTSTRTKARRKPASARSKPASKGAKDNDKGSEAVLKQEQATSSTPQKARKSARASTTSKAPLDAKQATADTKRTLQRLNKELQVRVRELELGLVAGVPEDETEGADLTNDGSSIIAMVKDLHGEIDVAYELKEALEGDLAATKETLAEEQKAREEFQARVHLLEAKAALADQLREDIAFVEEERNETARRLEQTTSQLGQTTQDRDELAEQNLAAQATIKQGQDDNISLGAKVLNLEETVAGMERLRLELAESQERTRQLEEQAQGLGDKLAASDASKNAVEFDLSSTRELVRSQGVQIEELNGDLASVHADLADLHAKLEKQEVEDSNLVASNKRAQHEIGILKTRSEALQNELDSSKKAMRDIRAATVRSAMHVRERYSGG